MKKSFLVVIFFIIPTITFANFKNISKFKNNILFFQIWLNKNNYSDFLSNEKLGNSDYFKTNLNPRPLPNKWGIDFSSNPTRDTLIYYIYKYQYSHLNGDSATRQYDKFEVKPSKKPLKFKFNLREDNFLKKQMKTKAILSYLLYEDGKIVKDEITPKEKFGDFINNETKLRSQSMGKSLVSYIVGHAICSGYIDSVHAPINDWPLLENTLYHNQKLINILNMNSGDQKYVFGDVHRSGDEISNKTLDSNLLFYMKDKKRGKLTYNYTAMNTLIALNYVQFKTKKDFENLLNEIFQKKAKVEHSVYFFKNRPYALSSNENFDNISANPMFFATRYDYLRIAKAILEDWQNDTCVGKYLKDIYKNRISKAGKKEPAFNHTKSYGGQFHLDYPGLKNRKVLGMGGYGGRAILIDVETGTIIVLNSLHYNRDKFRYNHKKLLIDPIKKKATD